MNDGSLTNAEQEALQKIADLFKTTIDVVGSRGAGKGRNIDTNLPFGKGSGTRSDIDVRIDGQREIDLRGALSDTLYNSVPGVSVGPDYLMVRGYHSSRSGREEDRDAGCSTEIGAFFYS